MKKETILVEIENLDKEIHELESRIPKATDYDEEKKLIEKIKELQFRKERVLLPEIEKTEKKEREEQIKTLKSALIDEVKAMLSCWEDLIRYRNCLRELNEKLMSLNEKATYNISKINTLESNSVPSAIPVPNSIFHYWEPSFRGFVETPTFTQKLLDELRTGFSVWEEKVTSHEPKA